MSQPTAPRRRKRIPYGMTNFRAIIEDGYYYVDKTRFIERIEEANRFFFYVRPRRFGKTLTLNMLRHYYDRNKANLFDNIFGNLYIGKHPTPEHNTYCVLDLNFSVVSGDIEEYRKSLDAECNIRFELFCNVYASLLPPDTKAEMNKRDGCVQQLRYLAGVCYEAGLQIYLFIDEYDHFTNSILAEPDRIDEYRSQTHGTGYLRTFFDTIKAGTSTSIARVFVTGVSPVTLDDLTSGFNIGSNYSMHPFFNEMTGFTEQEVRDMLDYYRTFSTFRHTTDELIEIMKPYYDNYCFAQEKYGETTMYNSCMVLYFVYNYVDNNGALPRNMIEENIRVDYNKLRMLIRHDREFHHDASIIQSLVTQGYVTGTVNPGFPAENIGKDDNFLSLLFYFGMVTYAGTLRGKTKLAIPNEVVREQIFTYLLDTYNENGLGYNDHERYNIENDMAYEGSCRPFFDYMQESLDRFASRRDAQKGEAFVHGFTLAMTCQCRYYRPISELDNAGGYADIFLKPNLEVYSDMEHSYIIELKYAHSSATEAQLDVKLREAHEQVCRYAATPAVGEGVGTTTLHRVVVLFHGLRIAACEEVEG